MKVFQVSGSRERDKNRTARVRLLIDGSVQPRLGTPPWQAVQGLSNADLHCAAASPSRLQSGG